MIAMLTAALIGFALLQTPAQEPKKDPLAGLKLKTYQFVELRKGASGANPPAAERNTMQMDHLARLEKMWLTDGKAVLVGPMMDNGDLRGIAVLDTTPEEAKALFDEDPFVKSGLMRAVVRPLMAAEGFLKRPPKFLDLQPYTLGFYRRPEGVLPKIDEETGKRLMQAHLENNQKMADAGALVWAGPFLDNTNVRGLLVFRETDAAKIKALVAEDALVKAGRLELELHPAMTAKGTFAPAAAKSGG